MRPLRFLYLFSLCCSVLAAPSAVWGATALNFTVNTSEAVTVSTSGGTPRLQLDIGGQTQYATYVSGSGSSALTFTYTTQNGDFDLDGITLVSPLQLNGGTITDAVGTGLSPLTFTLPATTGVKVDHPSLALNFIGNDYILNGTHYNSLTSFLTAASGSFTRASTAAYHDAAGVLQFAASGTPRFDYDPVTHAAKGILIEEARTNRLLYSGQMEQAQWVRFNVNVTTDALTAPSGNVTAEKLIEQASTTQHYILQDSAVTNGTTYTQSIYLKAGERSIVQIASSTGFDVTNTWANFNLATGTIGNRGSAGNPRMYNVGNGWYRCVMTATAVGTGSGRFIFIIAPSDVGARLPTYLGDGTSGVYIWGGQLEAAGHETSYISTPNTTQTRSADNLTVLTGSWFSGTAGTVVVKGQYPLQTGPAVFPSPWAINAGNSTNEIQNYIHVQSGTYGMKLMTGGATQFDTTIAPGTLPVDFTVATAYSAAGASGVKNGGTVATSSGTLPAGLTTLRIGSSTGGGNYLNGTLQALRYYPVRITDVQIQLATQ